MDCDRIKVFEFVRYMNACSDSWKISIDEISTRGVSMLDVFIYKGTQFSCNGKLDYKPFFKPSLRAVPLHHSSSHSPTIHWSWPASEIRRIHDLGSSWESFLAARAVLISRWKRFSLSEHVIQACLAWRPKHRSDVFLRREHPIVRIALPFHPALHRAGIRRIIARVCRDWNPYMNSLWLDMPAFQVAWRCVLKALWKVLRHRRF